MIHDLRVREPNAGKRKRIPLDPSLRHTIKRTISMPGDRVQQHHDDRDPDMIHHFRISARLEEERKSNYSPNMGIE